MTVQKIGVIGSINLDLVASGAPLPRPGETVTGASFAQHPGGKGANQALAAQRLGGEVAMIGRVGQDAMADSALALLRRDGVDLSGVRVDETAGTGVALIAVSPNGENQISVASGANAHVCAEDVGAMGMSDAVLCQLEVPIQAIVAGLALERERGLFAVNLAPAIDVPDELLRLADLLIVNEIEAAFYGQALHQDKGLVAITLGGAGSVLYRAGEEIARAPAFAVDVVDTTGAGDTFCGALVLALAEGRDGQDALTFASAAAALAVTKAGAQPSLPNRREVEAFLEALH